MAKKLNMPMLAAVEASEPPSHNEMLRDRAHSAHRDVVEGWVKGEKSDKHVAQSKKRLQKVLKDCR